MQKLFFPDYKMETEDSVEKDRYVSELIFGVNEEPYLGFGWYSLQKSEMEDRIYRFMMKEGIVFLPKLTTRYLKIEFFNPMVDGIELSIFINEINCFRKSLLLDQRFNELILTVPNHLIDGFAKINFKVNQTVIPNNILKNKDHRNVSIGVSKILQIDDS